MQFLSQIFRIVLIDLALSGDNAIVIGMAAHRLPLRQRRIAIVVGGVGAIVLRIALTAVAALLLRLQGLHLAGGLLLLWIGFRLLEVEEETHEGVKVAATMSGAVATILVADFIMSLDNVLGVAGASEGDVRLLMFGLGFSMVILMCMGDLVADLMNKLWWLAYAGSGVIAWTGVAMIFEDAVVRRYVVVEGLALHALTLVLTVATLLAAHRWHRTPQS
jgi:YjbE family integral membrane protein